MNLLVISHTPHYRSAQQIVGWGPTIIELDHLSSLFDRLVHIAPVYAAPPPASSLPYTSANITLHPVSPAGGDTFIDKIKIAFKIPAYIQTILAELPQADIVHVRCPANISLIAIILLSLLRKPLPRWYKYAGNWQPNGAEAWSYRFQRWWLTRGFARGIVTVNGQWQNQPAHIIPFTNPCMTAQEHAHARQRASAKHLDSPVKLLFVGRLDGGKGADRVIKICEILRQSGCAFSCDLIGDGDHRQILDDQIVRAGLQAQVCLHGWLPKPALGEYYAQAHFILLPTASEGFPKVLAEAMAYGVVPLASRISSIPQVLAQAGRTFAPDDVNGFANAVLEFLHSPNTWKHSSQCGVQLAENFTYEEYLTRVTAAFQSTWGVKLTAKPK